MELVSLAFRSDSSVIVGKSARLLIYKLLDRNIELNKLHIGNCEEMWYIFARYANEEYIM